MSIVLAGEVSRVDEQLNRLISLHGSHSEALETLKEDEGSSSAISSFETVLQGLSVGSTSNPLQNRGSLVSLLGHACTALDFAPAKLLQDDAASATIWMLVAKATLQTLGHVVKTLLRNISPLSDEVSYWEDVLSSPLHTSEYAAQTSPLKLWAQGGHVSRRLHQIQWRTTLVHHAQIFPGQIYNFYDEASKGIDRNALWVWLKSCLLSPVNHARADARHKLDELKTLIADEAFFIGKLLTEGTRFSTLATTSTQSSVLTSHEFHEWIRASITLMVSALHRHNRLPLPIGSSLMGSESEDVEIWRTQKLRNPLDILEVLRDVLLHSLPEGRATFSSLAKAYSRPALLTRYWLPGTVLLFSSRSLIQFVSSNRVEITEWIRNLGETLIDFWGNWVVEPIKKLIGTIRHEDVSEIALMSRASLEADQASLERMVIEFASDHDAATSSDVDMLRQRVKEGDLTEVLKSYERDLRQPFLGTVRGDLVRALLIQIQKTKVDVELAIGGIDALLRSQELVFGFIGLTPGLLVTYATFNWLRGMLGGRRGLRQGKKRGVVRHSIRVIDRILNSPTASQDKAYSLSEHGMLLCECETLCQRAKVVLPTRIYEKFQEDICDLLNPAGGVERQLRVLQRIQWMYAKYLNA